LDGRLRAWLARVRMAVAAERFPSTALSSAALGWRTAGRPHDSAACRAGAWRYASIYPLCTTREGARRRGDRGVPGDTAPPAGHLPGHRPAGGARFAITLF